MSDPTNRKPIEVALTEREKAVVRVVLGWDWCEVSQEPNPEEAEFLEEVYAVIEQIIIDRERFPS